MLFDYLPFNRYMEVKSETPHCTLGPNTWGVSYMHSFQEKIFKSLELFSLASDSLHAFNPCGTTYFCI